MYTATRKIYNELKKVGDLKVFTEENDDQSSVWLSFGINNGGSYRIKFISRDNDNDVAVRVFAFVHSEQKNAEKLYPVLNQLNVKYRYFKLCFDSDGDVNLEYDYPVKSNPEESALELVVRIVKIIDEAYPLIMRALWN